MIDRYRHVGKWLEDTAPRMGWVDLEISGSEIFAEYQKGGGRLGRRAFGCALLDYGLSRRQSNGSTLFFISIDKDDSHE